MKKGILIGFGVVLLALALFYGRFGIPGGRDCDIAVQQLREQVPTFTHLEASDRCDGLCIKGSLTGCTISDDAHTWFVNNEGVVRQVE